MVTLQTIGGFVLLAQQGVDGGLGFFFPLMMIMVLAYFMLIRPQKREQQRVRGMQESLKKNDHVVTSGGIYGTIVNAQQDSPIVTIRVDETSNTKLRVSRSSISRIRSGDDDDGSGGKDAL